MRWIVDEYLFSPEDMELIVNSLAYTYNRHMKLRNTNALNGYAEKAEIHGKAAADVLMLFERIAERSGGLIRTAMYAMLRREVK